MLWCELCFGFIFVGFFIVVFFDVIVILFLGIVMNIEDLICFDVVFGWYRMMCRIWENMVVNVNGGEGFIDVNYNFFLLLGFVCFVKFVCK